MRKKICRARAAEHIDEDGIGAKQAIHFLTLPTDLKLGPSDAFVI